MSHGNRCFYRLRFFYPFSDLYRFTTSLSDRCIGPIELEAIPKKSPQQILDVMGKLPLGKLQGPPTASKNGFPFLKSLSLEGCNFPYQNSKQLFSLVTLVIESQVG